MPRPQITCASCGRVRSHHAHGLCDTCYGRAWAEGIDASTPASDVCVCSAGFVPERIGGMFHGTGAVQCARCARPSAELILAARAAS